MGLESGETENSTARTVLANLSIVFGVVLMLVSVAQVLDLFTPPDYLHSLLLSVLLLLYGVLGLTDD